MKIIGKIILGLVLVALLWFVYSSVKDVTHTSTLPVNNQVSSEVSGNPTQTIGQSGGFHYFKGYSVKDNRLTIFTDLNRDSVVKEITTPMTKGEYLASTKTITLALSDTTADPEMGKDRTTRYTTRTFTSGPIAKIVWENPANPDRVNLEITLREEIPATGWKLAEDSKNPGNLYLDVLK